MPPRSRHKPPHTDGQQKRGNRHAYNEQIGRPKGETGGGKCGQGDDNVIIWECDNVIIWECDNGVKVCLPMPEQSHMSISAKKTMCPTVCYVVRGVNAVNTRPCQDFGG